MSKFGYSYNPFMVLTKKHPLSKAVLFLLKTIYNIENQAATRTASFFFCAKAAL